MTFAIALFAAAILAKEYLMRCDRIPVSTKCPTCGQLRQQLPQ